MRAMQAIEQQPCRPEVDTYTVVKSPRLDGGFYSNPQEQAYGYTYYSAVKRNSKTRAATMSKIAELISSHYPSPQQWMAINAGAVLCLIVIGLYVLFCKRI